MALDAPQTGKRETRKPGRPRHAAPRAISIAEGLARTPDPLLQRLISAHGPEDGARLYVEELRWPDGTICPRCDSDDTGWLDARRKHYCRSCQYQFRVTAGTIFHDSHVPLERWLVAVQLILESENGFPANQLRPVIGGSYKTAWFVGHRIRAALAPPALGSGVPLALASATTLATRETAGEPALISHHAAAEKWALVKSLVAGAYHRPSAEYLVSYWNEARWRSTAGQGEHAFRETICALLDADPLPYDTLVGDARRLSNRA